MDVSANALKPLGQKSYGSIPHLPGSRLGHADYHIHEGQAKIATEKTRDKHDLVIVQEKLDGSNVGVAKVNGEIIPITRAGYIATSSKYLQHHYFAQWVEQNKNRFSELLNEGERVCGEWLALAHGTRYNLPHEPFVAFDIILDKERITHNELMARLALLGFMPPHIVGYGPISIEVVLDKIGYGNKVYHNPHGAVDPIEGAVWRVERKGKVDFLTKFVHHSKKDGKYLAEMNGSGEPVWNINVSQFI